MARPMTPTEIVAQFKKWGVRYEEYRNWETHNRNHKGPWGPNVNGLMWHHTGSDSKDQRALLYDGYKTLPGPLCHFGVSQLGIVHLIGWGRANHAGLGDDDVLNAVINETGFPVDNESNTDGNSRLYGAEFWHSGNHLMPGLQYQAGILLSAAICDFHNWTGGSILGHGQWQPGKWDPGYAPGKMMDMATVQREIDIRLEIGPRAVPTPPSKPSKSQTYREVWDSDVANPPKGHENVKNKYRAPISIVTWTAEQQDIINSKLDKIMKHLGIEDG